jgi:hypothetical protein
MATITKLTRATFLEPSFPFCVQLGGRDTPQYRFQASCYWRRRVSFDWKTTFYRKYTPSELRIYRLTVDLHILDLLPPEPTYRLRCWHIQLRELVFNTCSKESHMHHKSNALQDSLWLSYIRSNRKRSSTSRTIPLSYANTQRKSCSCLSKPILPHAAMKGYLFHPQGPGHT